MTRVDDVREQLQQPPRIFLMPSPMVVGFPPFYRAAQPRFMELLPLEPSPNSSIVISQVHPVQQQELPESCPQGNLPSHEGNVDARQNHSVWTQNV
ncbi:uncharacterized protein DS421_10g308930 [Arachis hypogaea]|nr:uncharacterized protein DS421_10g308930 [Arachis hypogaea]